MGWLPFSKGGPPDYAAQAEKQEAARQAAIKTGTASINQAYSGFNNDFYNKYQQAYTGFQLPYEAQNYRSARNLIDFNLANRGLLGGSSVQKSRQSDLQRQNTDAVQAIADQAVNQSNQLKQQVEGSKDTQLGFLYQSADPGAAAQQATSAAASFSVPSTFPVAANAFSNLLNQYYYSQLVNAYKPGAYISTPPDFSGVAPTGSTQQSTGGN